MAHEPQDWQTVFSPLDIAEAQIVAARLTGVGIRDVVCREAAYRGIPVLFGMLARIDIIVPESEYDAAIDALIDLGYLEEDDDDEL